MLTRRSLPRSAAPRWNCARPIPRRPCGSCAARRPPAAGPRCAPGALSRALPGGEGDPPEDWFRFPSRRPCSLWRRGRREDSAQAYAVAVAIPQQAIAAAESRLANASPEERGSLEEEIRGHREAL